LAVSSVTARITEDLINRVATLETEMADLRALVERLSAELGIQ
jgi:uncharacterized protein YceH (UPF0502 family)